MEKLKVELFDSTLRDGVQGENVNFSVSDKIKITLALDEFGMDFIEAGNPASNRKDMEFFREISSRKLKKSKLVAFGSTRRKDVSCFEDTHLNALRDTEVEYVSIFGKCSSMHVLDIINTSLEENLDMISSSIKYLIDAGKKVFFDAEHFFDGYKLDRNYAISALKTAENSGASRIVLCDTNGGCFPDEIAEIIDDVRSEISVPLGIHCHNDTGCAVANSILAVKSGVFQVQGTFTGVGERCGNATLTTIIAGLQIKLGYDCVPEENLKKMTSLSHYISEISNMKLHSNSPYVGRSAFAHKGGMHSDGVKKNPNSFEHIAPESVGNKRNIILSEVAGRTAILNKIAEIEPSLTKDSKEISEIMDILKEKEFGGYQFEAADASFELLVRDHLGMLDKYFSVEYFKTNGEKIYGNAGPASAIVKVLVGGENHISADEGDGPVNAIDKALRKALTVFYPRISEIRLSDYKVRVVDGVAATAANVRVLIESTDGNSVWTTIGVSTDIINASFIALVDSIRYKLFLDFADKN